MAALRLNVAKGCLFLFRFPFPMPFALPLPLAFLWPVVQSVGKLSIFVAELSFVLGQFKVESLSWVSAHQVLSGVAKWRHICLYSSRIQSKGRSLYSPLHPFPAICLELWAQSEGIWPQRVSLFAWPNLQVSTGCQLPLV